MWGNLEGIMQTPWLRGRIPLDRHDNKGREASNTDPGKGGKINVAFADGHGETVIRPFFKNVRVTPYVGR
jgi:prepilin-type processing-associated H-X9-DG protein